MKTKNLVALSLLVGIGAVLHAVVPPILFGMKPDMMLTMMFLGIILFPEIKSIMLLSIVTGAISALTTGFPGGQIPNIIDKPVTALVFFGLLLVVGKLSNSIVSVGVLTAVGTVISGIVFLGSALLIVGLPGPFLALFAGVVLPAAVVNTIAMVVLYPVAKTVVKRTNFVSTTVISK
jgi:hypothetical protein